MADERAERRTPKVTSGLVRRVERLTPHMIRVVVGGEGLAGFRADEYTDHYVKLLFAPAGVKTRGRSTWRRSAATCPASSGPPPAPTPSAAGTPRRAS